MGNKLNIDFISLEFPLLTSQPSDLPEIFLVAGELGTCVGIISQPENLSVEDSGLFWFLCGNEVYTDRFFSKIVLKVFPSKHFTIL